LLYKRVKTIVDVAVAGKAQEVCAIMTGCALRFTGCYFGEHMLSKLVIG
jgi:hypothetical protein